MGRVGRETVESFADEREGGSWVSIRCGGWAIYSRKIDPSESLRMS